MIRQDTHLEIRLARTEQDLAAAQRLRYLVFIEELAGGGTFVDHEQRLERDEFDTVFDHLILVDTNRDQSSLDYVVGVYRMLTGDKAKAFGRFYSESEYDLTALHRCDRSLLELGRSCLHPDYRGGTAMFMLWQGLADYVAEHDIELLFGVASFHGTDIAAIKDSLSLLHHKYLAPPEIRVRTVQEHFQPMNLMAPNDIDRRKAMASIPALIKAYLRLGGYVGEGAFIDHAFNTTDVFLVMDTAKMTAKQQDLYTRGPRG
ncbi:MAG: GNAT family N-acetyltransferase [Marinosulfonomonas sp.]